MGIRDIFVRSKTETPTFDVSASLSPVTTIDSMYTYFNGAGRSATREEAMSVPTVARGRDIICSSIAGIKLEVRDNTTGMSVDRFWNCSPTQDAFAVCKEFSRGEFQQI